MYLYFITRTEKEELRHYEILKSGKESSVYTMTSNEKSFRVYAFYKSKEIAERDLTFVKRADRDYQSPEHKFINYTTAGRKIYQDQSISYSIKGQLMETCFALVDKSGKILSMAIKRQDLEAIDGAEVVEVVRFCGRLYKVNENPVYAKNGEVASTGEEENE